MKEQLLIKIFLTYAFVVLLSVYNMRDKDLNTFKYIYILIILRKINIKKYILSFFLIIRNNHKFKSYKKIFRNLYI